MMFLKVILLTVEILVSLLLIGVVLLQKSRSEGLGMAFGASMGESLFGSRAGNVLTRITVILGTVFLVNTIILAKIYSGSQGTAVSESLVRSQENAPMAPQGVPGAPGPDSGAAVAPGLAPLPAAPAGPAVDPVPADTPVPAAPSALPDESPAAK